MKNKKHAAAAMIAIAAVLILLIWRTGQTPSTVPDDYTPPVYSTIFSLLPPVIAITLALITKEVYSSLFAGITVGALLYANGNLVLGLNTLLYNEEGGFVVNITDLSHASILVFVIILGTLVALMNKSGGAAAFGRWASSHIKTRVGAELATVLLGVIIFVDDGFNCMTVGSVMRPVTDRYKISRSKLAYLIDATAAPICIIAPVSSWAAAVSYSIPEKYHINGFHMFIQTIPYNLYALTTLLMIITLSLMKFDYGPMKVHEANALKGDLFTTPDRPYGDDISDEEGERRGSVIDLVLPVAVLIFTCITGMVYTGGFFDGVSFIEAFANCNSAVGMVMGSLVTLLFTFCLYLLRGVVTFKEFMECLPAGFRSMCAPMIILVMSWNLSGMTGLLDASGFIHDVVSGSAGSLNMFLPVIIFVITVFLSFSTGTSWGTFTILIPIVCSVFPDAPEMLTISIAACLSGAVCGDHCSPISDTTIMSSAGSHCSHVNHVSTQLPYAMTAAAVCAAGYLLTGIVGNITESNAALICTPVTLILLLAVLMIIRRREAAGDRQKA